MSHRIRKWGDALSKPGPEAGSSLPGTGGGQDPEPADPAGNRAQRRAARRLGINPTDTTDQED